MHKEVDNCVGCGIKPCYHCTAIQLVCDWCGEEVDRLYDVDGDEVCMDCLKKEFIEKELEDYIKSEYKEVE